MFIKNIINKIFSYLYYKIFFYNKVRFNLTVHISLHSTFEGMNKICPHSSFHGNMGLGTYIGPNSCIDATIGRFTSIAPHVKVVQGTHPYQAPFVTTSPAFFSVAKQCGSTFAQSQVAEEFRYADSEKEIPVIIGSDCWIGYGATLISGIKIGDGAVILANATVTHDVPPYAVVGGVPAKIKSYRYDPDTIDFLLSIKWWNNSLGWFKDHWQLLSDIDKLKEYYRKNDR